MRWFRRRRTLAGAGPVGGVSSNLKLNLELDATPAPAACPEAVPSFRPLEAALARLPEEARRVLLLRHREHLSLEGIAQLLALSPQEVRNQWAAAVERLGQELAIP